MRYFSKYSILAIIELAIIVFLGVVVWGRLAQLRQPVVFSASDTPHDTRVEPRVNQTSGTILFVGDIMLDRYVRRAIEREQDPLYPFLLIASTTRAADLTVANLEGPISSGGTKQGSEYSFRFEPVGTINALQYAGIDVVNLANNHIWDYGRAAVLDTMRYLSEAGIEFIGFGINYDDANTPLIKVVGGARVAMLSYTEFYGEALWARSASSGQADDRLGLSEFNSQKIIGKIKEIKKAGLADIVVVNLHWGVEYETTSKTWQRELAHRFVDAGADLIIGHHPHVVQEVEKYEVPSSFVVASPSVILGINSGEAIQSKNPGLPREYPRNDKRVGYIAYSLGNFVFDQNFSVDTRKGLIIEAVIKDGRVSELKQLPIMFTKGYQPYLSP